MDIKQSIYLLFKKFPNCVINKQFFGIIGGEKVYAFSISIDDVNRFLLIYEDKNICEITSPALIRNIIFSLDEV